MLLGKLTAQILHCKWAIPGLCFCVRLTETVGFTTVVFKKKAAPQDRPFFGLVLKSD